MPEILAPAGDFECLKAAVLNGANAIYIGGSEFSARKYASNFSREEIIEAIRFCHSYNVKLYVTINTLLNNNEIEKAVEYAAFLYEEGIDAVIVQDIGFLKLLRENIPSLEVHGSTQMTVHNLEGVNLLYNMGVKRVVLSRELSIEEIKYIKENTKAEIEVFVHGALCICFSGQCLFSSMIGGRSGNRGTCAQSCRMEYSLDGEKKTHLLSPKDLSTLEFINSLKDIGVDSLKIEGRMKRYEYVATVVSSYKKALEGRLEKKDIKNVTQIFNRGGFTSAFMFKNEGRNMMSYKRPKNWGMYIGDVVKASGKFADIKLHDSLSKEDGIEIFGKNIGNKVSKIKIGNNEVLTANEGDIVTVFLEGAKRGDKIYKSSDSTLLETAKKSVDMKTSRKQAINGCFNGEIGSEMTLKLTCLGKTVEVSGDICERAINKPTTCEKVAQSLEKLGDTPFKFDNLDINIEDGIIIPASKVNSLRREACEALIDALQNKKEKVNINIEFPKNKEKAKKKLVAVTGNIKHIDAIWESGADIIFYGGDNLRAFPLKTLEIIKLREKGINVYPYFSEIVIEEFDKIKRDIDVLSENNINVALCGNLGVYSYLKDKGFKVFLDRGFNVFNSKATETFENISSMVSPELNIKQIRDLVEKTNHELMINVHGRQKLMVSRHCPVGSYKGDGGDTCKTLCENKPHYMKDRMGEDFLIYTDFLCRSHIYNSKKLSTIDKISDILKLNIKYLTINFLDEDIDEIKLTVKAYKDALVRGENGDFSREDTQEKLIGMLKDNTTKGHFYRGVI